MEKYVYSGGSGGNTTVYETLQMPDGFVNIRFVAEFADVQTAKDFIKTWSGEGDKYEDVPGV